MVIGNNTSRVISVIFILMFLAGPNAIAEPNPLTLSEAEHLAISTAPELQRLQAMSEALEQQAVAEGQLSDPKLMAGAINVPTNTFSFTQDDMTMLQVGLEQSFPRGHSLRIKSWQTEALALAEQRKIQEQTLLLLQNVQDTWLDLYYWTKAAQIIHTNRTLLSYLFNSTKSQYSVGKDTLSNVLQAELELSRLDDQSIQIDQQIDTLRAQLGRWIGESEANRPLANALPHWPSLPPLSVLQRCLQQHPVLQIDAANIEAANDQVALAKEQYKPGLTADVSYGVRQGEMVDGTPRSDMVTAEVALDLPIFTHNRQDRRLLADTYQLEAVQLNQQIHYRELSQKLATQYALWQRLSERENFYASQLIPEARENSKAALLAYQSATTDLATVLRADTNERNIQLEQLQIQIQRTKVRAALLYLEGGLE